MGNGVILFSSSIILSSKTLFLLFVSSITFSDSLGKDNSMSATPASHPHFTSLDTYYLKRGYSNLERMANNKVDSDGLGSSYVETQYHNQLRLDDIKKIHIGVDQYSSMYDLTATINEINAAVAKVGKHTPLDIFK